MATSRQRLKLLYLAKIFHEETDEESGLTMPQIVDKLAEYGISGERKSLYGDIRLLGEFGYSIERLRTSPVQYALVERSFSQGELSLLADAVQSSKFLTKTKADRLTHSIKSLGSKRQAKDLSKRLHVEGRVHMQNESVFYSFDAIQRAMASRKKVEFRYFHYDARKSRVEKSEGRVYVETPVQMLYIDDCFYLVAFNDKHDSFVPYRVDRMMSVEVSASPATRNARIAAFNVSSYEARRFAMFDAKTYTAALVVEGGAIDAVIDKFGREVKLSRTASGESIAHVKVPASPTFFGWVAQFGTLVRIESPQSLKEAYFEHLRSILDEG